MTSEHMSLREFLIRSRANPRWILSDLRSRLAGVRDSFSDSPFAVLYRRVRPYTMCGNARLRALYRSVEHIAANGVAGDVVECGAARGGSAALMGAALKQMGESRHLWVFDTFEGIPAPTRDDPDWEIASRYTGMFRGEMAQVARLFEELGILATSYLVKGRFQETLLESGPEQIALLHIDGDWYDSVKTCLEQLYDRVSPGGVIQIDDYGHWQGARKATDEFLRDRGITNPLKTIDFSGRQIIKPASRPR